MLKLEVIGNLGADAEVKEFSGSSYLSFRIAHSERYTGADNVEHERATWVSCLYSGNASNLLKYLKKGVKVFVRGYASFKVFSSATTHQMEVGVNVRVQELELCGSSSAMSFPLKVYDAQGLTYIVNSDLLLTPDTI